MSLLPRYDFTDLAVTRAAQDALNDHTVPYESAIPLSVRDVPVPGDPAVPVRIYAPEEHVSPLPAMVNSHGGGFVMGSVTILDHVTRRMAGEGNVVIIAVTYRLTQEHPFPAPRGQLRGSALGLRKRRRAQRRPVPAHCRRGPRRRPPGRWPRTARARLRRPGVVPPVLDRATPRRPADHAVDGVRGHPDLVPLGGRV